MQVQGYKKKTKAQLLEEVDKCTSISQLCALVQHEGIVIQMRCRNNGQASCLPQQKLPIGDEVKLESPLDKLKREIKETIEGRES